MEEKRRRVSQKEGLRRIKRSKDELDNLTASRRQAIAIKYDVDAGKAPKIMATGSGSVADMILEVAEENRVPFYEDSSLADLLSKLELDTEVPPNLYTLVAEVLAFVYQLDKLAKKRQKVHKKFGKNKKND